MPTSVFNLKKKFRLASNKIYVFNVLSAVTALIGFVGFGTFIPKFFEFHFRQEASSSGFASLGSSLATGCGVVVSGQVIARYVGVPRSKCELETCQVPLCAKDPCRLVGLDRDGGDGGLGHHHHDLLPQAGGRRR